jgi:hypothetical protein
MAGWQTMMGGKGVEGRVDPPDVAEFGNEKIGLRLQGPSDGALVLCRNQRPG